MFLSLATTCCFAAPASIEGYVIPVDVTINGDFIRCAAKPYTDNGSTYMPLRAFTDTIGSAVVWNDEEQCAAFSKNDVDFVFFAEKDYCLVNGIIHNDVSAQENNDILFIPVKFVCDKLGYTITWDDFYFIADVIAPGVIIPEQCKDFSYTRNDLLWLAKITHTECGAEPVRTRIGIANTVINRVRSPLYPNTIPEAILDTKHGVQYPPAHLPKFNRTPSAGSMTAAKCALNGIELVGTSVAFVHVNAFKRSWPYYNMRHYITLGVVGFFTFD